MGQLLGGAALGRPRGDPLLVVLTTLSLTTNLKLCLDAADESSWPGSGQEWLDVAGGDYDFFLGADGSAAADDPVFTGRVGALSAAEAWTFSSKFFRYSAPNESWMDALHKNGALFSLGVLLKQSTAPATGSDGLIGTSGGGPTNVGIALRVNNPGNFVSLRVGNGAGSTLFTANFGIPADSAWHLLGVTLDEAGGANQSLWSLDGVAKSTFNGTVTSPSASGSAYTMEIAAKGNGAEPLASTVQIGGVMIVEGSKWSSANFESLWELLTPRLT
jgi:hypothetical protein